MGFYFYEWKYSAYKLQLYQNTQREIKALSKKNHIRHGNMIKYFKLSENAQLK